MNSLLVWAIVCISLISAGAYRKRHENPHEFMQDDRITFPGAANPQRRPVIHMEYFENGTIIATYADGTPVRLPDTSTHTDPIDLGTRLTGIAVAIFFFIQ